jgi:glycosyltransferase involved in cell wall biosynthesis
MIAYYFPPEGSAGTFRSLRFVRQLVKFGWSPVVISVRTNNYERYDPELVGEIPAGVDIVRVRVDDLWQRLQSWRAKQFEETLSEASAQMAERMRAARYKPLRSLIRRSVRTIEAIFYQPDLAKPWIRPGTAAAIELCNRKRPDVIWASAGPVSAWIVARRVSQATGVPYVLDLRDPYGLSYYDPEVRPPEWITRRLRCTMHRLLKDAQAVIFLFDAVAECYYRAFPGAIDPAKVHIIPNGYEGRIDNSTPPSGDTFNLLYTGTLASYRYDTFLKALAMLKLAHADRVAALRVKFVGEGTDDLAKKIAQLHLEDIVQISGPVSYAEIRRMEKEAHALLVLGRLSIIKGYELFAGAKVFGYLKSNRPIIGVLPRDETRRVLERVGISTIADVDSPSSIVTELLRVIDCWEHGKLSCFLPDPNECEFYSSEHQTKALVAALEGYPPAARFAQGSIDIPQSLRQTLFRETDVECRIGIE